MSDYTKSTNFATKDNLTPGDPLKIVRGTEIDTEFNNIATAIATKTDNASAAITGGSITGITDLAIADGGTGASTANAALNNLLPSQTSASGKYLKSNGTDSSWDALDISTADITGTLPVANGGTGVTSSTGTGSVVLSNSPTLVTPALGTPASGVATNITGLPISTGVSGLGTGVATALAVNVGSAGAPLVNGGVLGTPSSGTATNLTGLPLTTGVTGTLPIANGGTGQTTANAAFNALAPSQATASGKYLKSDGTNTSWDALDISTADITGTLPVSNGGTGVTSSTGTGSVVLSNSPTLVTPALGTPSGATLTNATGLPISTGVSGLGTGVATALAVNVGSAGAPVVNGGALGTPSSGTATNLTGLPLSTGVTGTLPTTNGGTGLTSFTSGGVLYASSTSALTSGSALTFDGQYLGIGTGASSPNGIKFFANGGGLAANLTVNHSSGEIQNFATTNYFQTWYANNSEQMRLTSTGLGIGTSSPASKLDVTTAYVDPNATAHGTVEFNSNSSFAINKGGSISLGGAYTGTSTTQFGSILGAKENSTDGNYAGYLSFQTRPNGNTSSERMRLDSEGNLGLGVTPSNAYADSRAFEIGANGIFWSEKTLSVYNSLGIGLNFYYNAAGDVKYKSTGVAASRYSQYQGSHIWYTAASGTAGNAISFTQAMTLDSSGNLGVGTTSPSTRLHVKGASAATSLRLEPSSSTTIYTQVRGISGDLYLEADPGNAEGSSSMIFTVDGSERARIDSSGNLLVGTTTATGGAARIQSTFDGAARNGVDVRTTYTGGTSYMVSFFDNANTNVGSITYNLSSVAYNTSSDYRLKNTIAPMTGALAKVAQLKPVTYKWNADGSDGEGFIAHELAEVVPQCVTGEKDAVDEDGNPKYQGIDTSFLMATVVAALQELKAEFDAYKASHP